MTRRELLGLIAASAWPLAIRAEERRRLIGFSAGIRVISFCPGLWGGWEGLKGVGFIEGRDVSIEYRLADGRYGGLPVMAAELVSHHADVIVCPDTPAAFAAKAATRTIPIVFLTGTDPVKMGLIDSFSRPSGNLTGVAVLLGTLGPKRLELVRELLPTARTIGLLVNPDNPIVQVDAPETQAAANDLGLELQTIPARSEKGLESAFEALAQGKTSALVVMPDPLFLSQRSELIALAARYAVPCIYPFREFVDVGGLMSYGIAIADLSRLTGILTGKILGGAKPIELPVQQSMKFQFVVNLKTAKTLGLLIPQSVLARADEVIE
jgi:putative tryptophan/tyrosine transport system substrate-binding protein